MCCYTLYSIGKCVAFSVTPNILFSNVYLFCCNFHVHVSSKTLMYDHGLREILRYLESLYNLYKIIQCTDCDIAWETVRHNAPGITNPNELSSKSNVCFTSYVQSKWSCFTLSRYSLLCLYNVPILTGWNERSNLDGRVYVCGDVLYNIPHHYLGMYTAGWSDGSLAI